LTGDAFTFPAPFTTKQKFLRLRVAVYMGEKFFRHFTYANAQFEAVFNGDAWDCTREWRPEEIET